MLSSRLSTSSLFHTIITHIALAPAATKALERVMTDNSSIMEELPEAHHRVLQLAEHEPRNRCLCGSALYVHDYKSDLTICGP